MVLSTKNHQEREMANEPCAVELTSYDIETTNGTFLRQNRRLRKTDETFHLKWDYMQERTEEVGHTLRPDQARLSSKKQSMANQKVCPQGANA